MDARYMPDAELVQAMSKAFDAHLRQKMRERILAAIEPELNAAIDDAMKAFEVTVSKFRDHAMHETTMRVVLSDRRTNK